jgi:outer membrane autotransporter protein
MKKSLLTLLSFSIPAATCLLFFGSPAARAAEKGWTGKTGVPVWATLALNNWSGGILAPTRFDTAIFGPTFTPSPADAFFHIATNGSEVLLVKVVPVLPGPIADNLIFENNWKLTEARTGLVGFFAAPLTLRTGNITVDSGHTATIDADLLLLNGQMTKLGTGTLLLERTVFGNINVNQGTLGGNFTVTGNLLNLATLSPGNSPGSVGVQGSYQQGKTGALALDLASRTAFDHVTIGGAATLGGDLNVTLDNGYRPKRGDKFVVLSAAGGVKGEFEEVDAPVWDLLTLRPFYSDNSVALKAVVNSFDALPGLSNNEHAVAQNLDRLINDPREAKLINYLYDRNLNELPGYFDRIAPEELTSIFTIGTALATVQSLNIQRRTDDLRSGASGFSAQRFALSGGAANYSGPFGIASGVAGPNGRDGKESKETKAVAPAENRWGVFLSGTGEWVSVGNTDNTRGYNLDSGGFTLGVDYKVTPHFAIGLAAGYTGTTADLVDRGRVWVNGGKLGLYATTFAGGWYADAAAFGGYSSFDTRRTAIQGEARGDGDGGDLNALFGTGYDFKAGSLTFGPTATFNYTYVGLNGFTEHGSLAPLDIHGGSGESLRSAFGFKASFDWKAGGILIRPELRAAWQHEFGDASYSLASNFADGEGGAFTSSGPQLGRDSVLLGAGFAIQCSERCSTYFYYDGELGRKNYQSNAVTGGIRLAF